MATAIEHYAAYKPRPFTRKDRDNVTILYGGLTWKHERIVQGVFHNLQYKAQPIPNITRADLDAGKELIDVGACCPTIFTTGSLVNWADDLCAAAAPPNVFCKLSGMITLADPARWQASDLKPYIAHAIDVFGPDRLMFGSDWPVCTLAATTSACTPPRPSCWPASPPRSRRRSSGAPRRAGTDSAATARRTRSRPRRTVCRRQVATFIR